MSSIQWDAWAVKGRIELEGADRLTRGAGTTPFPVDMALKALKALLSSDSCVTVAEVDWKRFKLILGNRPFLSETRSIKSSKPTAASSTGSGRTAPSDSPLLDLVVAGPKNQHREILAIEVR
jgi:hypothetical protein